ncbi:hypothetical protein BH10ACI3_BH10ACI3_09680 [soil metagenome]
MNINKTVLVISDSQEQFEPTASLLRNDGYSVRFEKDVSRDLMHAGETTPHLIISELAAPNIDGLQVCRQARGKHSPKTEAAPVLLVGDLSVTSTIVGDGFRCGAADYMQRPIDPLRLADLCRDMLQPIAEPCENFEEKPAGDLALTPSSGPTFASMFKNDKLSKILIENSRLGLALFSGSGRLVEMNPVLKGMLDYSEAELGRMTLSDFFFPHDLNSDTLALGEIRSGARDYLQVRNGYLTPGGERTWGSLTIFAINDANSGSRFLIGLFDDPTNQNHAQTEYFSRSSSLLGGNSTVLDLTQWTINKGLICQN